MSERELQNVEGQAGGDSPARRPVSGGSSAGCRGSGWAVGLGAGLGRLLAACGEEEGTTTDAGAPRLHRRG